MKNTTRALIAAFAVVLTGSISAHASSPPLPDESNRTPAGMRNPVAILVGGGESLTVVYVEANSPMAPVPAFAGAPANPPNLVHVFQGGSESAQSAYVPRDQAPAAQFATAPARGGRG